MINIPRLFYSFAYPIKKLSTTAVSTDKGISVTFPGQDNQTVEIRSALEMIISSIAACETASLLALAKRKKVEVGKVHWTRIESSYDLNHWNTNGGPSNKMGEVFLEAEVETSMS